MTRPTTEGNGTRTIVLVGHCGPDVFMLRSAIGRLVPGTTITSANDARALAGHLHRGSVLLVNRNLDGSFKTRSGIDLIRTVTGGDDPPTALLVSNLPRAQKEAEAAGAARGFGKNDLYAEETAQIIRAVVGQET